MNDRIILYKDKDITQIGLLINTFAKNYPMTVGLTGGFFNGPHRGHVDLLRESKQNCNFLIVAINNDAMAVRKSGYSFMPFEDRAEIISEIRYVDLVVENPFPDMVDMLKKICPDVYLKGGDRSEATMLQCELEACEEIGCQVTYNTGGEKVQSSSSLLDKYYEWRRMVEK